MFVENIFIFKLKKKNVSCRTIRISEGAKPQIHNSSGDQSQPFARKLQKEMETADGNKKEQTHQAELKGSLAQDTASFSGAAPSEGRQHKLPISLLLALIQDRCPSVRWHLSGPFSGNQMFKLKLCPLGVVHPFCPQ